MNEHYRDTLNQMAPSGRDPDYHANLFPILFYFDELGNISDFSAVVKNDKDEELVWSALQRLIRPNLFDRFVRSFLRGGR
jgi:hypothetical protein